MATSCSRREQHLAGEPFNLTHPGIDGVAPRRREPRQGQLVAAGYRHQTALCRWNAVMKERGVNSLQPASSFVHEVFVEPHQHPCVKYVRGWDPCVRHPSVHEELAEVARISSVGLGKALPRSQSGCLRRLGHMSGHAHSC